jgi:peptide-methionine (S)-S-oxide reductase
VEAVYQRIEGIIAVASGYCNGLVENPTYKQVCTGETGHAEVIQITFDPKKISFAEIIYIFWRIHDPTTLNRQGYDAGTQYRSGIFYHNQEQKEIAEKSKLETDKSGLWNTPIVTEISALKNFYLAEDYHQNYYNDNTYQPYCSGVIAPKIKKLEKEFKDRLKKITS